MTKMLDLRSVQWSTYDIQFIYTCKYMYNLLLLVLFALKYTDARKLHCS